MISPALSDSAKLLLLTSLLSADGIIPNNGKIFIKEMILRRDPKLKQLLEKFEEKDSGDSTFVEEIHNMIMEESEDKYNELFEDTSLEVGKTLSKEEREKKQLNQEKSLIYGEVEYNSFYRVLRKINPPAGLVFYDLGSGTGKAVFAARLTQDFSKCIGIEILEGLHGQAAKIVDRYNGDFKSFMYHSMSNYANCYEGSFLDYDWSDGDVVFANSTCFDDELMLSMSEAAESLKPGAILVTFTKGISSKKFEVLEKKRYKMSWGPATVFIHRRLNANGTPVGPAKLNILPSDNIDYDTEESYRKGPESASDDDDEDDSDYQPEGDEDLEDDSAEYDEDEDEEDDEDGGEEDIDDYIRKVTDENNKHIAASVDSAEEEESDTAEEEGLNDSREEELADEGDDEEERGGFLTAEEDLSDYPAAAARGNSSRPYDHHQHQHQQPYVVTVEDDEDDEHDSDYQPGHSDNESAGSSEDEDAISQDNNANSDGNDDTDEVTQEMEEQIRLITARINYNKSLISSYNGKSPDSSGYSDSAAAAGRSNTRFTGGSASKAAPPVNHPTPPRKVKSNSSSHPSSAVKDTYTSPAKSSPSVRPNSSHSSPLKSPYANVPNPGLYISSPKNSETGTASEFLAQMTSPQDSALMQRKRHGPKKVQPVSDDEQE